MGKKIMNDLKWIISKFNSYLAEAEAANFKKYL